MSVNSKKKGNRNERALCKKFEEWTGYEFTRTPSSGGLRWKRKDDTVGDIVCIDERHGYRFKFVIEAKWYADIEFNDLINGNTQIDILDWWDQVIGDAKRASKIPMVFMRQNGMKKDMYFVIMDMDFYMYVFSEFSKNYGELQFKNKIYDLMIINSEDLWKADYSIIHKLAKQYLKS